MQYRQYSAVHREYTLLSTGSTMQYRQYSAVRASEAVECSVGDLPALLPLPANDSSGARTDRPILNYPLAPRPRPPCTAALGLSLPAPSSAHHRLQSRRIGQDDAASGLLTQVMKENIGSSTRQVCMLGRRRR